MNRIDLPLVDENLPDVELLPQGSRFIQRSPYDRAMTIGACVIPFGDLMTVFYGRDDKEGQSQILLLPR